MKDYNRYTSKDGATLTMSQWGGSPSELELYRKLAELEDKIEDGTLKFMPCKVGDKVYTIDLNNRGERVISEAKIAEIVIFENGVYYNDNTGVWLFEVFKTKAEAEAMLLQLKGDK